MASYGNLNNGQRLEVIQHIFMPPKLPHKANNSECAIIATSLDALVELRGSLQLGHYSVALERAIKVLATYKAINGQSSDETDENALLGALVSLTDGASLVVGVNAQNAAILITRKQTKLILEAFELSPQNESIIATKGRLVRTFPGMALTIDDKVATQDDFMSTITKMVSKMSQQDVSSMQPKSQKAGKTYNEQRDTPEPAVVTELLFGILRGLGELTSVSEISKNMRDEVLWDNAFLPWRRSPSWTLIRVVLQLVITRSPDGSRQLYKLVTTSIMSRILQSSLGMATDLVFAMRAKIGRRLHKISSNGSSLAGSHGAIVKTIEATINDASNIIESRWRMVQDCDTPDLKLSQLAELDFLQDSHIFVAKLDDHITAMMHRQPDLTHASFTPASGVLRSQANELPLLPITVEGDRHFAASNLQQFEQWVALHLTAWLNVCNRETACEKIHDLTKRYHHLASQHYKDNPEGLAVMLLTMYELWVACDTITTYISPLVAEYDPGLPSDVLQNLLLPSLEQMKRLRVVEKHLADRRLSTKATMLIFDKKCPDGLASRYFDNSPKHQALLAKIESEATIARKAKMDEFDSVKAEYGRLDSLYNDSEHEYTTKIIDKWCTPPETEKVHAGSCKKCTYQGQRDALDIKVHEWPLPRDPCEAKTVVFELDVPSWLGHWRDMRNFFLHNVLKGQCEQHGLHVSYFLASNDPHLTSRYYKKGTHGRIGLLSEVKPVLKTHYAKLQLASLTKADVCVKNGLQYRYYDNISQVHLGVLDYTDALAKACTYQLQHKAHQQFIFRPASAPDGPQPNAVIASQDACPANMTTEEFKDLFTMPLGRHVQWANILLQLESPSVDFKKLDTTLVVLQCIHQAGPPGASALRESHRVLEYVGEAHDLLASLAKTLQRVKDNFESAQALCVIVAVANRILSLSDSQVIAEEALAFLKTAREVLSEWLHDLIEKTAAATTQSDRELFLAKRTETALIIALTFNVDDAYLAELLAIDQNVATLLYSAIIVHEGGQLNLHARHQYLALLDLNFRRLLHRGYHYASQSQLGMHNAIQKYWSGFTSCSRWHAVSQAGDHWLTTATSTAGGVSMSVHCNLLSGEVLVNGLPLDRPPAAYRSQPLYATLFGSKSVEVMPSSIPGFQFSTKRTWGGCVVHLGLTSSPTGSPSQLTVRAIKDGLIFETIPAGTFQDIYPTHFAENFVHWYGLSTNCVEFRPLATPWHSSPEGWILAQSVNTKRWQLIRQGCSVVGLNTTTSECVAHILHGLTRKSRLHNIVQAGDSELCVEIPSSRLGFRLSRGASSLASQQFRSMIVDSDQSVGTLIGLTNKVVLKATSGIERLVLIPESDASYIAEDGHIAVTLSLNPQTRILALRVNTILGRLDDDGDIGSKLFVAYLHALTSHCEADPLTRKSGTEQAIVLLESAAVRSFDQLSQDNLDMLATISKLTPRRCYYPIHEKVMQTVSWDSQLSWLSQHNRFQQLVVSIVQQSQRSKLFFPEKQLQFPPLDGVDEHLNIRDMIRSSSFRNPGFGAEEFTVQYDSPYTARDRRYNSARSTKVSIMATILTQESISLHWETQPTGALWNAFQRSWNAVLGQDAEIELQSLQYDSGLLEDALEAIMPRFLVLHRVLPEIWQQHPFSIIAWLSTLVFADCDIATLQIVALLCRSRDIAQVQSPTAASFSPREGSEMKKHEIQEILEAHRHDQSRKQYQLARLPNERAATWRNRKYRSWQIATDAAIAKMLTGVVAQWPCEVPDTPAGPEEIFTHINMNLAMTSVRHKFQTWHDNGLLVRFSRRLEELASSIGRQEIRLVTLVTNGPEKFKQSPGFVSEEVLFQGMCPGSLQAPQPVTLGAQQDIGSPRTEASDVCSLLDELNAHVNNTSSESEYIEDLIESLDALTTCKPDRSQNDVTTSAFEHSLHMCEEHAKWLYRALVAACATKSNHAVAFPRLSPAYFLQQLARKRWCSLSPGWRSSIVAYALSLNACQHAQRLVNLSRASRREDLLAELRTLGHTNWIPMQQPETLLMEVESGITVRENQEQIAAEMRQPSCGSNAVMQLNMGEGKSSVIVPIVAAALADRSQLVRVVVAKPQSKQMAQMLISKVGGLLDRRVYYLPFSRSLQLDQAGANAVMEILQECLSTGGILLVQPEHILSLQLMAPECYITGKEDVGKAILAIQDYLDANSRDVVDESDENFSPKYELIYTMGTQKAIEASPDRWLLIHRIFDIVRSTVVNIAKRFPTSLEVADNTPGGFPRTRILRADGEQALLEEIAHCICSHGIEGLRIARQPERVRDAVFTYISKPELTAAEISAVEDTSFWSESTKSPLLLLRGLIAGGVLAFTLQKRWRVHYGLASRSPPTQLAVPYRAKDSPTPRSEFSHPDVVITLASLSHYYRGLDDDDLYTALGHLIESDQADIEYQAWVKDCPKLPDTLRQVEGINLQDGPQCTGRLFPALRYGKAVVDYFLAHHVFPKEMKEFPSKLTVSGWDLGKRKDKLTTGFSGTHDSRRLLPIDVAHLDLEKQKHTDALVLEHILQPENSIELLPPMRAGTADPEYLLRNILMLKPNVQVILDVGAQILELDNKQVATAWLRMHDPTKEAAIFINDTDDICVIDREDRVDLLRTSSFQSRLDCCLVFLDEAHTRGIDLQLPVSYRAAVTLGAGLTKDRLVQACMRMRKLGRGQTVVFCITPEIQAKVIEKTGKTSNLEIGVRDVLLWSITETHAETQRSIPLWAVQGERFVRQERLWQEVQKDGRTTLTKGHAEKLLEDEAQSLEDRYRPREIQNQPAHLLETIDPRLRLIADRCQKFEKLQFNSNTLLEEQERELAPEVEQERQSERAPPANPVRHILHKDVLTFAQTGVLVTGSKVVIPAFEAFTESSAAKLFPLAHLEGARNLLVTQDFALTVQRSTSYCSDIFQRPVQWLLSNRASAYRNTADCLVVISPYEANHLIGIVRASKVTALHLYKPRTNLGYNTLDKLDFHTISAQPTSPDVPRLLALRLCLFAGQLYISSYSDYLEICKILGLSTKALTQAMSDQGWEVGSDGFILRDDQGQVGGGSRLPKSPVSFFKVVIESIRRNGDSILKTDMGALLEGKLFQESDFERG